MMLPMLLLLMMSDKGLSVDNCEDYEYPCASEPDGCKPLGSPCDGVCYTGRWLCGDKTCLSEQDKPFRYSCGTNCLHSDDQCDGSCTNYVSPQGVGYYPCGSYSCYKQTETCQGQCDVDWCKNVEERNCEYCAGCSQTLSAVCILLVVLLTALRDNQNLI